MRVITFVRGVGVGAAGMYFFDPQLGRRRRAIARDKVGSCFRRSRDLLEKALRDLTHRTEGLVAKASSAIRHEDVSDEVLVERLRSRMGRVVSNPGSIDVKSSHGHVTLSGHVFKNEIDKLIAAINEVAGVEEVESRLQAHDPSEKVPGLEMKEPASEESPRLPEPMSPGARLVMGAVGGGLALRALVGMTPMRSFLGTVGLGMLARCLEGTEIGSRLGLEREGEAGQKGHGPRENTARQKGAGGKE